MPHSWIINGLCFLKKFVLQIRLNETTETLTAITPNTENPLVTSASLQDFFTQKLL